MFIIKSRNRISQPLFSMMISSHIISIILCLGLPYLGKFSFSMYLFMTGVKKAEL